MRRALAIAVLALAGCGGGDRLTVYAAASLTDVLQELEPDAEYNFAGSDELATQIAEGAEADVFVSAGATPMRRLRDAGIVEAPLAVATNRVVAVVPRDSRARTYADLARRGVKIVVAAEGVPLGDYTREMLRRTGQLRLLRNVVSEEEDARSVLGKVALGEADAGFVYATDARAGGDDVRALVLPSGGVVPRYYAAALSERGRGFVRRLAGPGGGDVLDRHGFGPP